MNLFNKIGLKTVLLTVTFASCLLRAADVGLEETSDSDDDTITHTPGLAAWQRYYLLPQIDDATKRSLDMRRQHAIDFFNHVQNVRKQRLLPFQTILRAMELVGKEFEKVENACRDAWDPDIMFVEQSIEVRWLSKGEHYTFSIRPSEGRAKHLCRQLDHFRTHGYKRLPLECEAIPTPQPWYPASNSMTSTHIMVPIPSGLTLQNLADLLMQRPQNNNTQQSVANTSAGVDSDSDDEPVVEEIS